MRVDDVQRSEADKIYSAFVHGLLSKVQRRPRHRRSNALESLKEESTEDHTMTRNAGDT